MVTIKEEKLQSWIRKRLCAYALGSLHEIPTCTLIESNAIFERNHPSPELIYEGEEKSAKEEDVDFNPEEAGKTLQKPIQRLLDPDISPQKFFKFDQQMDASGSPTMQAQALAGFALTYGDNEVEAKKILQKALQELPKMAPVDDKQPVEEATTRISSMQLRKLIRRILFEQVVGYTPPKEKATDDEGYLAVGDMGVDTSLDDPSTDEKQASADQVKKLTQQRQQALNKGDTVTAQNAAQQLAMARRMRG